ncbi:hypothetical protein Leryth_008626 [Lithospermum erythrorhizon]|uniref:C2H2-type domain-containing protein n=1 Tax=Lithospermum erythrorhizon TaxID=34254 RepID=A0AAV3NXN0_LITER|nr:hypothetical protein Leryth_008626 [Lithospermum erythrorhizon]
MVPLSMKRAREVDYFDNITNMANCLMLLSHGNEYETVSNDSPSRVFECKTCNRQFSSFQALGGHRASHKKPKVSSELSLQAHTPPPPPKPKTHECSICGLEFSIGQALGGHMRRHRVATNQDHMMPLSLSPQDVVNVPVVKKSNSRRIMCLDLNLTPSENGLEFPFILGKVAPHHRLDCYL